MRCEFSIVIKEILEDDANGLLDGVGIVNRQGSGVLCVEICDYFLPLVRLSRKDLFEGPNKFFVMCFHLSDYELIISSCNNQNDGL